MPLSRRNLNLKPTLTSELFAKLLSIFLVIKALYPMDDQVVLGGTKITTADLV